MAIFTTTQSASHYINTIIDEASHVLILISAFVRMNTALINRLKFADERGVTIYVIVKTGKLREHERDVLGKFSHLRVYENEDLHAKCYMNEQTALITSMNLYEYSQQNNIEFGVLIGELEDAEPFQQLKTEVNRLIQTSNSLPLRSEVDLRTYGPDLKIDEVVIREKMLKQWRISTTAYTKFAPRTYLSDELISQISFRQWLTLAELQLLLKDTPVDYQRQLSILNIFYFKKNYRLAKVIRVQSAEGAYDSVTVLFLDTNREELLTTKLPLPAVHATVVLMDSGNGWLNECYDVS